MAAIDFWLDLASSYSYLSAFRIEALTSDVDWRPFTLGPIFAAKGWTTSPFNLQPEKGRYMWRDVERLAADQGLPFRKPSDFPRNSILALRVSLIAMERGFGPAFCRATLKACFAEDRDIAQASVVDEICAALGQDGPALRQEAISPEWKPRLRARTEDAASRGIFGAPTFFVGDEMFWGNDRLEQAVAWSQR